VRKKKENPLELQTEKQERHDYESLNASGFELTLAVDTGRGNDCCIAMDNLRANSIARAYRDLKLDKADAQV